ncbi:MAG TPA: protein kinase, partial [Kofleriaceae bacterium]|nr:protein kinase [Kofleriaceae bacterium]
MTGKKSTIDVAATDLAHLPDQRRTSRIPGQARPGRGDDATRRPALADASASLGEVATRAMAAGSDPGQIKVPRIGDTIGENSRFIVTQTLGVGGMGLVCRARDRQLDRSVAVKFVHRDHQLPWEQLAALLRQEAKATAKLNHENIVSIFDIGVWGDVPFLVMEHLDGEPLLRLMRRGPLHAERATEIMIDVLAGLEHAHRANVIHRDLKPGNVFIVQGGRAKILDFGLARIEHATSWAPDAQGNAIHDDSMVPQLASAGTPPYMAPEQWRSGVQDARTDIWAAGVLFYEMLTGELPQGKIDVPSLRAWSSSRESAPSILSRRPNLPESIERIVSRALRKDRRQRFQNATEFLTALREALAGMRSGAPVRGDRKRAPERRPTTLLLAQPAVPAASSDDPDDVIDALGPFQQVVAEVVNEQGGRIFSASDSVLAGFGYPIADEHDALRAVRAGLGMVEALRERGLSARIGIHTGVVVVEELGDSQGTAVRGGAPRTAAALAERADMGTVLLSDTTYKLVQHLVSTQERPSEQIEGQEARVYRVLSEEVSGSRFEPQFAAKQTPLVGRKSKIRLLRQLWEEAKEGHGNVVRIWGEGGIGKSRLVQELRMYVEREGHTRLTCQAWPHFRDSAFRPLIELLLRSMHIAREDPPAVKLSKLEKALPPFGFKLSRDVPVFAPFLSIPLAPPYKPLDVAPSTQKQKTLNALVQFLLAMTRQKPVLFVVEDMHWIDHSTIELLQLLLESVATARVLVLLTARPEYRSSWPDRDHLYDIHLKRLSSRQTSTMIRSVAGHRALPPKLAEQLIARTDGIPLFIEEMTSMVAEAIDADGTAPQAAAIPATLSEILLARLDRLPSTGMAVARVGAAIGRTFSYGMLSRAAGMSRDALSQGLTLLIDARLLVARGRPPDARYRFKHALIQDSAYQSLVKKQRQELHGRIAQVLASDFPEVAEIEPELLAHHHTEAGHAEQAFALWKTAGERAVARSANVEAVGHFQHALHALKAMPEHAAQSARELGVLLALGSPLMAIKGYANPEVEKNYARAYELCQLAGASNADMFPAIQGLWQFYMVGGNVPRALALGEQLLALARSANNQTFQLLAHRALGTTTMLHGDLAAACEHHTTGLKLYDFNTHKELAMRYTQDPGVAHGLYRAWTLWLLGFPDSSLASAEDALALAKRVAHPLTTVFALSEMAMIHCYRGEYETAKETADKAIRLSVTHKLPLWLAWANIMAGWARSGLGDYNSGVSQLKEGLAGWKGSGARAGMTFFPMVTAECCRRAGWLGQAVELVAEAAEIVSTNDEHYYEAELFRVQGELDAAVGDLASAEDRFRA